MVASIYNFFDCQVRIISFHLSNTECITVIECSKDTIIGKVEPCIAFKDVFGIGYYTENMLKVGTDIVEWHKVKDIFTANMGKQEVLLGQNEFLKDDHEDKC